MLRIPITGLAVFITIVGCVAAQSPTLRTHRLLATPTTIAYGYYWADATPVLRVASGDIVDVDTVLTTLRQACNGPACGRRRFKSRCEPSRPECPPIGADREDMS
jgi:hypothetical protein